MAKTGTPTGTVYVSPRRKQARAKRRKREEQRWAAKAGPVTVTYREILPNNHEILPNSVSRDDAIVPATLVEPQWSTAGPATSPAAKIEHRGAGR